MTDPALPSLTVLIASYNAAATLPRMLESLARQHYPAWWELVVVDNGSTDATYAVAQEYARRFPRCSVLQDWDSSNQAGARNFGLARSSGEAIVCLDSDDEVADNYLLEMGRALSKASLVGARLDISRLNTAAAQRRRKPIQTRDIEAVGDFLPAVVGATMGVRREAMTLVGGWDDGLSTQEDMDLSWRLHRVGIEPVFVPGALLHYRYREGASQVFRQEVAYGEGAVALYMRHRAYGMPRPSLLRIGADYVRLGLALLDLPRDRDLGRVATQAGARWGKLRGSIRHRTLYP